MDTPYCYLKFLLFFLLLVYGSSTWPSSLATAAQAPPLPPTPQPLLNSDRELNETMSHKPVIIVGGGPVGLAAALELARFNVHSVVVEQHDSTSWHPKTRKFKHANNGDRPSAAADGCWAGRCETARQTPAF
jgi:hypothetical protein